MATFSAIFDADVLTSVRLTDLAIRLATTGLFRILWTADIHGEWMRAVTKSRPSLTSEQIERRRRHKDLAMPHALVTDYASLISGLSLPDPNDRHVLAAAIKGRADVIVTFNLKDFPNQELGQIGIEAQHPDVFFSYQRTLDETLFLRVVKEARAALQAPPSSPADYIGGLRRQGLQNVADELEKAMPLI